MPRPLSLRKVSSTKDICSLRRDCWSYKDWRISTDGFTVWITKQKLGHAPTDHITVPKSVFDRLFDHYAKPRPRGKWRGDKFFVARS